MLNYRSIVYLLLVFGLPLLSACSKPEEIPRSRDQIFEARMQLPALYFTTVTHKKVIAPANKHVFVDPESGEPCMPALVCNNPDCPGRKDGEPFLFFEDIVLEVKPDKKVAIKSQGSGFGTDCPKCRTLRNVAKEKPADRAKYTSFVTPYVLPENTEKSKALDDELKRRILYERSHQLASAPTPVGNPQPTRADPSKRPEGD